MLAMSNLGWYYTGRRRYEDAEGLLLSSVDHAKRHLGQAHGLTLWFSLRLSFLYHRMGRYEEQDELVDKSLAICLREHGERYPLTRFFEYWVRARSERPSKIGDD
jgi:hypothetical protein